MTEHKTIGEMAREVIMIQDACNIIALSNLFHNHCVELMYNLNSMDSVKEHPIMKLWMSKFDSMTGGGYSGDLMNFMKFYNEVEELGKV